MAIGSRSSQPCWSKVASPWRMWPLAPAVCCQQVSSRAAVGNGLTLVEPGVEGQVLSEHGGVTLRLRCDRSRALARCA